jgi:hypothetical protein
MNSTTFCRDSPGKMKGPRYRVNRLRKRTFSEGYGLLGPYITAFGAPTAAQVASMDLKRKCIKEAK